MGIPDGAPVGLDTDILGLLHPEFMMVGEDAWMACAVALSRIPRRERPRGILLRRSPRRAGRTATPAAGDGPDMPTGGAGLDLPTGGEGPSVQVDGELEAGNNAAYPATEDDRRHPTVPSSAPAAGDADPWKAIDGVSLDELMRTQMPIVEKAPIEIIQQWGAAVDRHADAMVKWASSGVQGEEAELDLLRTLKWLTALPQLLLRKTPSKRNRSFCKARERGEAASYHARFRDSALARRFQLYTDLHLPTLIAEWREEAGEGHMLN